MADQGRAGQIGSETCGYHATGRWCWHDTLTVTLATVGSLLLLVVLVLFITSALWLPQVLGR